MLWLKGNLHAHSSLSDGDSAPGEVVSWYRDHGYDFLALTDHDVLEHHDGGSLLLVPGEEVSSVGGGHPIHVNAYGPRRWIAPIEGDAVAPTLRATVSACCAAGAIAAVNHPNFRWSLDVEALLGAGSAQLLEIWNGHPEVRNEGDGKHPSAEALWDQCLSLGRWYWGIAVDDTHHFRSTGSNRANPGRGWVVVRARERTVDSILRGLVAGDFYASTGVVLEGLEVSAGRISFVVVGKGPFRTVVVGRGGRVLAEREGNEVDFVAPRGDGYLRARIEDARGGRAWTQPVAMLPCEPGVGSS